MKSISQTMRHMEIINGRSCLCDRKVFCASSAQVNADEQMVGPNSMLLQPVKLGLVLSWLVIKSEILNLRQCWRRVFLPCFGSDGAMECFHVRAVHEGTGICCFSIG